MAEITLKEINTVIATISKGEMTFKQKMGQLSRDMLTYVRVGGDIDAVNRLLAVLTPKNKEMVKKFFNHHLPYTWETKSARFGSKSKNGDVVAKKEKEAKAFLSDGENTIWTWLTEQANHEPVAKPKEYAKKIEDLVRKAIDATKDEHIPVSVVIRACIKAGCSLAEIIEAVAPAPAVEEPKDAPAPRRDVKEDKAA